MKKQLVVLALLTVSTVGYAKEVVSSGEDGGLWIIDGKKVYKCYTDKVLPKSFKGCTLVSGDYTKSK